jgi:hypothetical protein
MNIPSGIFSSTPMFAEKVSGFYGFRGTMVIKIQTNAQKFQTGILLVSVVPCSGHITNSRISVIKNLTLKSQLPSVRMNVAETDEVEIRIPFTSPELFYNFSAPIDWARVFVTVYSPSTGGDIPITCWCHFEDTEFLYPAAQSGISSKATKKKSRKYDNSDLEDNGGWLSQPLSTFSKGFAQVANRIPMISSFAAPTAWFLELSANIAHSFGLSKAIDTSVRWSVVPRLFSHMANCDVNDTSDSHGLLLGNKIAHMPGFAGSDVDEMSLQYIAQVPSYFYVSNWANTATNGTTLLSLNVGPQTFNTQSTVTPTATAASTLTYHSPIGYLTNFFAYWRGSIYIRMYMSKNEFHTGRLLIVFNPTYNGIYSPAYAANEFNYRWIWDIRDSFDFEIKIPYVSSTTWTPTSTDVSAASIGVFKIFVLNPLTAPSSVANNVNILFEARGGEDFEVAGMMGDNTNLAEPIIAYSASDNPNMRKHRARPYVMDKLTMELDSKQRKKKKQLLNSSNRDKKRNQIFAQGPAIAPNLPQGHIPVPNSDGNIASLTSNGEAAMYTTGEAIVSLRQILKRACLIYQAYQSATVDRVVKINPFTPHMSVKVNGGANSVTDSAIFVDAYSTFASLFALRRGGVVIKAVGTAPGGMITSTLYNERKQFFSYVYDASATRFDNFSSLNNQILSTSNVQGAVDALIPFYGTTAAAPVMHPSGPFTVVTDSRSYSDHHCVRIQMNSLNSTNSVLNVYRQVSDDFSLGCFLGTVPLYTNPRSCR